MTEEDTFNALKRIPLSELLDKWRNTLLYKDDLIKFAEDHLYTIQDFLGAWYDAHADEYIGYSKEEWVIRRVIKWESHARRRRNI